MAELNLLAVVRRLDTGTRAQYLRLIWRVRQDVEDLRIHSGNLLEVADGLKVQKAKIEEYNPTAWRFYQHICHEFQAGKTVIPLS